MIANILLDIIAKILKITQKLQIPIMFMGGIATSIWAEPRATYDIDGVVDVIDMEKFLKELSKEGFTYDKNKPIKLIQNLPFITLGYSIKGYEVYVDLFLSKTKYVKESLIKKQEVNVSGITIPVISPDDLILYKLLAGRNRDIEDVRQILSICKDRLDMKYIKKWASELGVMPFLNDEISSLEILGNIEE
ncbi:MAG: nucleotidyltransferase [bacterium]